MEKKQWNNRNRYFVEEKNDEDCLVTVFVTNYIKNLQIDLCFGHSYDGDIVTECLSGFQIKNVFYELEQLYDVLKKYYPTKLYPQRAKAIKRKLLSIAGNLDLY